MIQSSAWWQLESQAINAHKTTARSSEWDEKTFLWNKSEVFCQSEGIYCFESIESTHRSRCTTARCAAQNGCFLISSAFSLARSLRWSEIFAWTTPHLSAHVFYVSFRFLHPELMRNDANYNCKCSWLMSYGAFFQFRVECKLQLLWTLITALSDFLWTPLGVSAWSQLDEFHEITRKKNHHCALCWFSLGSVLHCSTTIIKKTAKATSMISHK